MTQYYVGVKIVQAWKEERDGQPGYGVRYDGGYTSWSPKAVFEAAYLPMGEDADGSKVMPGMVDAMLGTVTDKQLDDKTTIVTAETLTGFRQHEVSACVDPKNYDHQIGVELATRRIKDRLWMLLGFVVQWGRYGLKR
jgi:hypothetical protein